MQVFLSPSWMHCWSTYAAATPSEKAVHLSRYSHGNSTQHDLRNDFRNPIWDAYIGLTAYIVPAARQIFSVGPVLGTYDGDWRCSPYWPQAILNSLCRHRRATLSFRHFRIEEQAPFQAWIPQTAQNAFPSPPIQPTPADNHAFQFLDRKMQMGVSTTMLHDRCSEQIPEYLAASHGVFSEAVTPS